MCVQAVNQLAMAVPNSRTPFARYNITRIIFKFASCASTICTSLPGPNLALLFSRIATTVKFHASKGRESIVVVDDLMAEIMSGDVGGGFIELITNGRHAHTAVWVLTQGIFKSGGAG